jgi:hypothetical protein
MYARVATWEGGEADAIRASGEDLAERAPSGPPEGVPAKGFLMLVDAQGGRSVAIALFDSEEDMRQGDETLNAMTPEREGVGSRTSVEMYEVAVDLRAP